MTTMYYLYVHRCMIGAFFLFNCVAHGLHNELCVNSALNLLDIPEALIVEVFLNEKNEGEQKESLQHRFRKFLTYVDDNKHYPILPLINKKLLDIYMRHGVKKTHFGMLMAIKKSPSEEAIEFETILAAEQRNHASKKGPHMCNSITFAIPYALTLVLLMMNGAHQVLFDSYFAEGAWAYGETAVAGIAAIFSVMGAIAACDNKYTCCGKKRQGGKCCIFYGMLFHILLGVGNFTNLAFSCLSRDCSTGAYLPITASTAGICSVVMLMGALELFLDDGCCRACC
jgi:hypothetical protein